MYTIRGICHEYILFRGGLNMERAKHRIRIAICDDEKIITTIVKNQLEKTLQMVEMIDYQLDIYHCGMDLLESDKYYHLILLDIEMPEINGLDVAKKLDEQKKKTFVVFLTNHKEFMPKSFHVKAFRFLTKPIQEEEFQEAIFSAVNEVILVNTISIKHYGKLVFLAINEITHIEALSPGCTIYTEDTFFIVNEPLKHWETVLSSDIFAKSHRAFLINLGYVKEVCVKTIYLTTGREVKLASRERKKVKDAAHEFLKIRMRGRM